jgi:transketolase
MTQLDASQEALCINTLRMLAVDAVEAARSGHPGMPLGAAAMAFVVWHDFLRFDPHEPRWHGRDRFVLSAGHGSALLYSLLHCAGAGLSLEELKQFRQWGSRTPGHPEYGCTPGVETTTGPLGQGFGNAVGMGLAAKLLADRYGSFGKKLFGNRVFALVSDGDLQEGLSHEAASLAAHWGLGNLLFLYDSNDITIEGDLRLSMSEDVGQRFRALGWSVAEVDGNDAPAIRQAIASQCQDQQRPSLIIARTNIGYGSPKEGSAASHGAPLGPDGTESTRAKLGLAEGGAFHVPDEVRQVWAAWATRNGEARRQWEATLADWAQQEPKAAAEWQAWQEGTVPGDLLSQLVEAAGTDKAATRALSGKVLQRAATLVPSLLGGSADLSPSNKTSLAGEESLLSREGVLSGRNIHFGIREHGMGSIVNGLALHGPWRPYCGTFLVFSDYMRPSMRLAAMMGLPVVYVMTHDSFFVGEDGPTHQPVEHLWALRSIPRLRVMRPADGVEVAAAWTAALESKDRPFVLALSRQGLPPLSRSAEFQARDVLRGGYVLAAEKGDKPQVTLMATGSEVSLAVAAQAELAQAGVDARVVSLPCLELFQEQSESYQRQVLPAGPTVVLEAGITTPWKAIAGPEALCIGLDDFGHSAPAGVLVDKLGFQPEAVSQRVLAWLGRGDLS